jgi:L-aspartate oxidase
LEYVQFHPTALHIPDQPRFLLTEALRGEGAILRDGNGRAFAKEYHEAGELAPRDIVARAVFNESLKGPVYLDITHRDGDWLHRRFPSIHQHLQRTSNLDLAKDPLPVIPAAHYTCGGVQTNLSGQTTMPNLYAAGEAARTGLHGGNRLASTSLLEGLVFGAAVADDMARPDRLEADEAGRVIDFLQSHGLSRPTNHRSANSTTESSSSSSSAAAEQVLRQVRQVMWEGVGVTRTTHGLSVAAQSLEELQIQAAHYHKMAPSRATAAARDAATSGYAVASAAYANPRSAGAHFINDDNAVIDDTDSDQEEVMQAVAVGN